MKESILKKYFEKEIPLEIMASDLKDSQTRTGLDTVSIHIEAIRETGEFQISIEYLIRLCDNVINGDIELIDLNTIAFALISSEYFTWDSKSVIGQRVETVVYDWDNSNIGFDLTIENVKLWKDYLTTGNYRFNAN
jgi:hypothetical protein